MSFRLCQFLILSCLTACLLMGKALTSPEVRQKRSDDAGPLEAVVEQLSQQVNSLNAQLTSVHAEIAALKTKTVTLDKTVAFHAWGTANPVQTAPHGIIVLNHAATNIGSAYNTLTGVFTAPVSGLYDFQTTIMSYDRASNVHTYASMFVDSKVVASAISDSRHGYFSQPAIKAVVHVNSGQQVYIKNVSDQASEYYDSIGEPYTTFSGFLVQAD